MSSITSQVDSYYAASANPAPSHPRLEESRSCDVCVIGGGITGCTAALHLAERGYDVVLLEAARVGWGASGRSGGQKIFGYSCDMGTLRRGVGASAARRLWELSVEALELVDSQIRRFDIDCDLRPGHLHAAIKPRHCGELRAWKSDLEDNYGYLGLELLEGDNLREHVVTPRYRAALFDARSGHLHPLNYTLGLAAAAASAGTSFFESSPVQQIDPRERPRVRTQTGEVTCDHLLLCTNAYLGDLAGTLRRRMIPVASNIIATAPMGEERARGLLPTGAAVADLNHLLDYYRLSADHRMLFGGRVSARTLRTPALKAAMRARMLRVFPQLADLAIDYVWGGHIAITRSRAPDWGRLHQNVYYAQGYSGHGMALSGLAGKLMAEAIAGTAERFDLFGDIPHREIPTSAWIRESALSLTVLWYRLLDRV